jgi:hypothetical protein
MMRRPDLRTHCQQLDYGIDNLHKGFMSQYHKSNQGMNDRHAVQMEAERLGLFPPGNQEVTGMDMFLREQGPMSLPYHFTRIYDDYLLGPAYSAALDGILLVSMLPNLQVLAVDSDWFVGPVAPLDAALRANSALRLKELHIAGRRGPGRGHKPGDYVNFSMVGRMTSLRKFSCRLCALEIPEDLTPASLAINEIELYLVQVNIQTLTDLINGCRTITSFSWKWVWFHVIVLKIKLTFYTVLAHLQDRGTIIASLPWYSRTSG